ncbi:hypothetical protein ES705_04568 [subsurface metagenome]
MNKKVMALIFISGSTKLLGPDFPFGIVTSWIFRVFIRDAMIRGIYEGFGSRRCDVYAAYA